MFTPIDDILSDLRAGKMIVLTDDENRENEGDLVLAAQFVTADGVAFMLGKALGYMCLSLTESDCDRLELVPQAAVNTTMRGTAFTVSIDLSPRHGGTTGVSAKERAKCIQMAIDGRYGAGDFVRPGHVNPLRSRNGGVLVRTGQTEGSVDLCRLAGLYPAAAIIEIMKPDGEMARVPDLERFCAEHKLRMCSVAQIIEHRLARESLIRRQGAARRLRTSFGEFDAQLYHSLVDPLPHLVLSMGLGGRGESAHAAPAPPATLVRMHRRHLLGDVFGDLDSSVRGPTGDVLRQSLAMIAREGRGAVVYLRTQGAGDDLEAELQTLSAGGAELESGSDTPQLTSARGIGASALPMPNREFGIGGQILRDMGLTQIRLITSNPKPLPGLDAFGLQIVETVTPR